MLPGASATQVSVVQYGATNTEEVKWSAEQRKANLLRLVEDIPRRTAAAPALGIGRASEGTDQHDALTNAAHLLCPFAGFALQFAVQAASSSVSGGRVGVAKAVVMLVTDKSTDDVKEAANEALTAGQMHG